MNLTPQKIEELIGLVRKRFPSWTGFADPDFVADEVAYKQATIAKAQELLSETELRRLIAEGQFDEFIARLDTVGKDNNLLWRSVPLLGDLGILYQPDLDRPAFCQAVLDLLYGAGPSHERLRRYAEYAKVHHLPNKWTFPTYFLFVCHPDSEMFVKPQTTKWFLQFVGAPPTFTSVPTPPTYVTIRQVAQQLLEGLQPYEPRDMVDIQSLIWVCAQEGRGSTTALLSQEKRDEFQRLFAEFLPTYPSTPEGQYHTALYKEGREQARRNFEAIVESAERGEDVTDRVLLQLLPYTDTSSNREKGAWIHVAPSITGDLRGWFEANGWTRPEAWPLVGQAILRLVRRCNDTPQQLAAACAEFVALPYTKGLQTGMLTPILNALRPDDFSLVNNKSRRVINYLANTSHAQSLSGYPATNATAQRLVEEIADEFQPAGAPDVSDGDLFDMFCHWLVAVKRYNFQSTRYWQIAPGREKDAWNWESCRDGGFIATRWDEFGDVSGLSRAEFNTRRDELLAQHPDWLKGGADQVWRFAHIREGDRIVASRGSNEVLGLGTVTGPYHFVPGVEEGHRLLVDWDDLTPRRVEDANWQRTLTRLSPEEFEHIVQSPALPPKPELPEPFASIFCDRAEAEWAFDLLQETFQRLGITEPNDERFALTLPWSKNVLRLNFGNWAVLQFYGPAYPFKVAVALRQDLAVIPDPHAEWGAFARGDPPIQGYNLPAELVRPLTGSLREVYEKSMADIAQRFHEWRRTPFRRFNQPEIVAAVLDPAKRATLLTQGLRPETRAPDELEETPIEIPSAGHFGPQTFDLLAQLHQEPTHEFYTAHKEALRLYVIEPFKQLMAAVRDSLPSAIRERMETEKRVYANILKQFAQQGCWDFYWGAFYPKSGKRIEDAQLFISIYRDWLEYGFYIGEYGSEQRSRFVRNCQEHYATLVPILQDRFAGLPLFFFGAREEYPGGPEGLEGEPQPTLAEWLRDPASAGIHAAVFMPKEQVLQRTSTELVQGITDLFQRLFPLVLLAMLDDPMPAIGGYLNTLAQGIPPEVAEANPVYPLAQCAEDTHVDLSLLERWARAIERKGQAILYGPPGTGKTFVAEHLARHLIGGGDGFVELVQFHPAYAYEDFIQGLRPKRKPDGQLDYPLVPGRFLDFCARARECQGICVLIVDEINRANLARVFGELMYLLEYRNQEVPLAAGGKLRIPANVRLIGTMNTADRSIALVDHALRRRFAFLALYPNYDLLRRYHQDTGFNVEPLIALLRKLNRQIDDPHYEVGVTFFLRDDLDDQIEDIWRMEIEPYLEEYFFDQRDKVEAFRWDKVVREILVQ